MATCDFFKIPSCNRLGIKLVLKISLVLFLLTSNVTGGAEELRRTIQIEAMDSFVIVLCI